MDPLRPLELAEYIVHRAFELSVKVLGEPLELDTICFFTHSAQEFEDLRRFVTGHGEASSLSHGATTYVSTDITIAGQHIKLLGVREPDQTRPEAGYGDFPVKDFDKWLSRIKDNPHAEGIISGRGQPLIELKHPDFDVRGYIADVDDHLPDKQ